jgi:hypothetical protein
MSRPYALVPVPAHLLQDVILDLERLEDRLKRDRARLQESLAYAPDFYRPHAVALDMAIEKAIRDRLDLSERLAREGESYKPIDSLPALS